MNRRFLAIIGLATLAGFTVDVWLLFWGDGKIEFGLWPLESGWKLPPGLLPLLGLVAGVSLTLLVVLPIVWKLRDKLGEFDAAFAANPKLPPGLSFYLDRIALFSGAIAGTVILLLILAVRDDSLKPIVAAIVLICGTISAMAAVHALRALGRGESVEYSSYWGGLGGGQGGWRLSPVTTLLVIALIFLAATVTVATNRGHTDPSSNTPAASASKAAGDSGGHEGDTAGEAKDKGGAAVKDGGAEGK